MITGKQIQELLDKGYTVFSHALGRIGRVIRTNGNIVSIKLNRGTGGTSFVTGDPVELVVDHDKKEAKIVHPEWAMKKAFGE